MKRSNTGQRLLTLLLTLAMMLNLLSMSAWAAELEPEEGQGGTPAQTSEEEELQQPEEATTEAPTEEDELIPEEEQEPATEEESLPEEEATEAPAEDVTEAEEEVEEEDATEEAAGLVNGSITYQEWNGSAVANAATPCSDFTTVTDSASAVSWDSGWYVVSENAIFGGLIIVNGTVNLILCDGAKLTASAGINVHSGNTLNIYPGSTGTSVQGGGELSATGVAGHAGIGGGIGQNCGTVNIHGGANDGYGGNGGSGGTVNIYGGTVTATGWVSGADWYFGGAGIGGGDGAGGNVTILGGTVIANGGGTTNSTERYARRASESARPRSGKADPPPVPSPSARAVMSTVTRQIPIHPRRFPRPTTPALGT